MYKDAWINGKLAQLWRQTIVIPIPKQGKVQFRHWKL